MFYVLLQATELKRWHKIYLRLMRQERVNDDGVLEYYDVATIDVDCKVTDKQNLNRIREEYVDPSGTTSVAKTVGGDAYRVINTTDGFYVISCGAFLIKRELVCECEAV